MGRPRTPTAILDARGSFLTGQNPSRARARENEPSPTKPLGGPPKYLSDEMKKVWKEIAKRLAPGVAMESDRDAFEMLIRLTYQMRNAGTFVKDADGLATLIPPMKSADRGTLISLWGRFAMTPSDRSKVSVEKPKGSKLDQFMARKPSSTFAN